MKNGLMDITKGVTGEFTDQEVFKNNRPFSACVESPSKNQFRPISGKTIQSGANTGAVEDANKSQSRLLSAGSNKEEILSGN